MITITGIGDHLRLEWPITIAGMRTRGEVVSKIWEYIRSHNLQNPENRREILADDKLTKGTARVSRTGSLRHGQGDHVRHEQAPHPTSEVREPG